jgi:pimeloyl-ACP methyl ester carboxylesterase
MLRRQDLPKRLGVPSLWVIVAAHDETIPPDVERDSAKRMADETLVLESSHVPMLSQPAAVAGVIAKAAASL